MTLIRSGLYLSDMHPELFKIGSFAVAWYGVLITLGVLIGAVVGSRLAERRGLNANLMSDMIFWAVLWGVVGARVVYVLTSASQFTQNADEPFFTWLIRLINIREGGLAIHGGLIFGIAALYYYQRRYKINFYQYADLFVPGVALGIIGGRLGNFFNGNDTVGRLTASPLGWTWPNTGSSILGIFTGERNWQGLSSLCFVNGETKNGVDCLLNQAAVRGPVHLTQIYGVFIGVALTIAAFYWLRSKRPGWVFWQFIFWYSLLRSVVEETFRLNPLFLKLWIDDGPKGLGVGLLTLTQIYSIPLCLLALFMLWRIGKQPEQPWGEGVSVPKPTTPNNLISSANPGK